MNSVFTRRLTLLVALLFALPQGAVAAPKIVVSIPPLHALVSGLMEGVGEPVLLYRGNGTNAEELTLNQKLHLMSADLVVWAGPGYEQGLSQAVNSQFTSVQPRLVTLSNHVPLLPKAGVDIHRVAHPEDRQATRDLSIWLDPKLAVMAIHHLSVKLALLDPEHLETYLDNEIRLTAEIQKGAKQLSDRLATPRRNCQVVPDEVSPYFSHRFGLNSPAGSSPPEFGMGCGHSAPGVLTEASSQGQGAKLYLQLLEQQAQVVSRCNTKADVAESGATGGHRI